MDIHCKRATELISDAMQRKLTRYERLCLGLHLFICTACRRYRKQVRLIRQIMRDRDLPLEQVANEPSLHLSVEARERIVLALRKQAEL